MEVYCGFLKLLSAERTTLRGARGSGRAGGPMKALFKYAIVLTLGLAVGFYAHEPLSLADVAKLNWIDEINVIINQALVAAKPQEAVVPVDPARVALVDEDLDYRIAQRIASLDGWRSFLAAHGNGVRTQSARAEVERLLDAAKAPGPAAAAVTDGASPDAKGGSEMVGSDPPSLGTAVAAFTPDEICKHDGDRLERLRSSPTSEEIARFADELGCERLRPQLLGLIGSLRDAAPAPAAAEVSNGASPDAKATSEAVGLDPPSLGTEVAAFTPDEICKRDGDRLERLRSSPTNEEAARFANELGCERLRSQLLGLMESLRYAGSVQAAAPGSPSAKVGSALGPKQRATSPRGKTGGTTSSRSLEPKRHAYGCASTSRCSWTASHLPSILLALLGDRPKYSIKFGRTLSNTRPNDLRAR
jgi:hypothetical protein